MENPFSRKDVIYTIYQEKSFSKAAQKLFIAQPSLSVMVKRIEQQIGLPLFDRTTKPIQLTEAGREYIAAVERLNHAETAFHNYVQAVNDLDAGSLGIGSNQLLSSLVLPRYITQFAQKYPKIKLTVLDANSTTLENAIMSGQLDIIIGNHTLPKDLFEQKHIADERLLLAVPAAFTENVEAAPFQLTYEDILNCRHFDKALPPVPLRLFSHVPFVLMNRDNDTRKLTNALFTDAGITPHVLLEMDRLVTLYSYIELGLAASIVSDTLIRNIRGVDHSKICFYPLPVAHTERKIFVSYKRNRYYSKAMAKFIEEFDIGNNVL